MSESQSQDAITYRQELLKIIRDEDAAKQFEDRNLFLVLKFLRKGPMTLEDLVIAFKEANDEKSDKTIYRYLNKLGKTSLVARAGKRISTNEENQITTQTLYTRTAKVFFNAITHKCREEYKNHEEKKERMIKAIGILVGQRFNKRKGFEVILKALLTKIDNRKQELLEELVGTANEEALDCIADLDWKEINYVLESVVLLALLNEKTNWQRELTECYSTSTDEKNR